jgi:hypothetical protein
MTNDSFRSNDAAAYKRLASMGSASPSGKTIQEIVKLNFLIPGIRD